MGEYTSSGTTSIFTCPCCGGSMQLVWMAENWLEICPVCGFERVASFNGNGYKPPKDWTVNTGELKPLETEPEIKSEVPKIHHLKIYFDYADAVLNGTKTFEVRRNDRGYQKGDWIKFEVTKSYDDDCFDHSWPEKHLLNGKVFEITYVHSGLGMENGFVVLGLKEIEGVS